jgi:hypothetical protein
MLLIQGKRKMQVTNQNLSSSTVQTSNDNQNSNQDQHHIYTLESLIQTLEEAANHLNK